MNKHRSLRFCAAISISMLLLSIACTKAPDEKDSVAVSGGAGSWITDGIKVISAPAGSGTTVAVVDGSSQDLKVRVFDADSGEFRFSAPYWPSRMYGGMGVGGPAVVDDVVIGLEPAEFGDVLVAYDGVSGKKLWEEEDMFSFAPYECDAFVCTEEGEEDDGVLIARDPRTGEQKWSIQGSQTFVVNEDGLIVMIGLGTPILSSLDPKTGSQKWRIDLSETFGPGASTDYGWNAHLVENVVIASVPGSAADEVPGGSAGVNPADGTVLWSRPELDLCPMHIDGMALLCGAESGMRRINPATGQDIWVTEQFSYLQALGPFMGITSNLSHLVAHDSAGKTIAIDAATGTVGEPDPNALAWMVVVQEAKARRSDRGEATSYIGLFEPVPWNVAEAKPAEAREASEIPEFVGVALSKTHVFVDGEGNLRSLSTAS